MTETKIAFDWVQGIIASCRTTFHFDSVDILIDLFEAKFNDADLVLKLKSQRQDVWNSIHNVLV